MGGGGYLQLVSTLGVFEVGVWDKGSAYSAN
jgi:hypothetical protein